MSAYEPILVDGAAVLPVLLDEAKLHLRVDGDDEDDLIEIYLRAAVTHLDGASGWLGRAIVAQTWSQQFDTFARSNRLGLAPVSEISAVVYHDDSGVEQAVADSNYYLINARSAPELRFIDDFLFPDSAGQRPAFTVTFVGGYGDNVAVPEPIKAAILLMVGDLYQQREAKAEGSLVENKAVRMLLDPYRTRWVA